MLGFMKPLVENFIPFAAERMASIRHTRALGLVMDDHPKARSKATPKPRTVKFDAKTQQVISGLDATTQAMIQQVLNSK